MLPLTPPAIVRPVENITEQYVPTAADLAEMTLADAIRLPAVARLLISARECVETNGQSTYGVAHALCSFAGFPNVIDPDMAPARTPSTEPAPF